MKTLVNFLSLISVNQISDKDICNSVSLSSLKSSLKQYKISTATTKSVSLFFDLARYLFLKCLLIVNSLLFV